MHKLSLVVASGGHSSSRCGDRSSSRCAGLSLSRPLPVAGHRLQTRRLSNCGSRAQPLRGMWDPPRPGLEPVSPALLAGRFSTTAPPGKPLRLYFCELPQGFCRFPPSCCTSVETLCPVEGFPIKWDFSMLQPWQTRTIDHASTGSDP